MSSTQQDSSDFRASRVMKAEKVEKQTRRSWSPQEEAVLLASLKELVSNGWKSDNGFRSDYLAKLEEAIAIEFPGTNQKGLPHINSKIQIWKKHYGSLSLMLARSGVGFNVHRNHQIDCTNEQWEQIAKCDVNAKTMRYKLWPMFEDWKLVFGKDRANRESTKDLIDAVKELNQGKTPVQETEEADSQQNMSVENMGDNSTCHSEKSLVVKKTSGNSKKRKVVDPIDKVTYIFMSITSGTNERLDKIVSRIGYEYDQDQAKNDAFNLVEAMPGLTLKEKFIVTEIFVFNHDRLLIFKGLPESAKPEYVQHLLQSNK